MKNKNTDIIKEWVQEAGLDHPSKNLKYQILQRVNERVFDYQPVIKPLHWIIMGISFSGLVSYYLIFPEKEGVLAPWLTPFTQLFKLDVNIDFSPLVSTNLSYGLLVFATYLLLFPLLLKWWRKKLIS